MNKIGLVRICAVLSVIAMLAFVFLHKTLFLGTTFVLILFTFVSLRRMRIYDAYEDDQREIEIEHELMQGVDVDNDAAGYEDKKEEVRGIRKFLGLFSSEKEEGSQSYNDFDDADEQYQQELMRQQYEQEEMQRQQYEQEMMNQQYYDNY